MDTFHKNTPKRLTAAYRAIKPKPSFHRLADQIGVNVNYVYGLMVKGKEPVNPDIRVKLFLPRHPRQPRAKQSPAPEWLKQVKKHIRRMSKDTRQSIFKHRR